MLYRVLLLTAALGLAACADKPAQPLANQPAQPAAPAAAAVPLTPTEMQQAIANASPEERRQAIASLTVAKCFLENAADNSFRGTADGFDGLESRGTTDDGVDVYVDQQVGMMVSLSDTLCHVMVAGTDIDGFASMVEPTLAVGGVGEPKYQRTEEGWGTRFTNEAGQNVVSIVRPDTIPGSGGAASVSVFVVKE